MVEKMSQVKASIKVMSAYVSMASEEGGCPLCKRKFTEQERDAFVQETSEEIKVRTLVGRSVAYAYFYLVERF